MTDYPRSYQLSVIMRIFVSFNHWSKDKNAEWSWDNCAIAGETAYILFYNSKTGFYGSIKLTGSDTMLVQYDFKDHVICPISGWSWEKLHEKLVPLWEKCFT